MAITSLAPDVYTRIEDLSQYVDAVPSTGLLPVISEKGQIINWKISRSDFLSTFGEPNIRTRIMLSLEWVHM